MAIFTRARSVLAAVRGMSAPSTKGSPQGSVADLIRQISRAAQPPPVEPAYEAQRLARAHVEPSVRTFCRWTPADLKAAQVMADGGNLQRAADLCEAILGDDRAPAVLNTRVNAVLGSELSFEAGRGRSKKKAVKALEVGEDWYATFDESVLGQLLLWGRLLGVAPAQNNWREFKDQGGRLIGVAENWHARHLRWNPQLREWRMRVGDSLEEVKAAPGDGKWIIFTPSGTNRPWAHGLWRGMSRLWLLKQYALDDWGRHSEVHGQGLKVGVPPKIGESNHGNKKVRQELANDLAELANDGVVVLPPGFDLKLVEASANTWEMFRAQIDMANSGMSIMAIGSNLPTEVGNGAATGATAQTLVRLDYKRADAEALSTMAHDQNLVWWAEFNYGDRGLAPWPHWAVEPKADQKARAELYKTVMDALDKGGDAGVPLDVHAILEEFEIPQRAVDEDEVRGSGKIFKYHLDYGILDKNELRRSLGFDPKPGGNAPPKPIAESLPGRDIGQDALSVVVGLNAAPARQATLQTLRTVWLRGASLAGDGDRDECAMIRVRAFLHLLANGEPEHPAYTADDDLLPVGHERRNVMSAIHDDISGSVSLLGSPTQPRARDGKWTDGHGGGAGHAATGSPKGDSEGGGHGANRAASGGDNDAVEDAELATESADAAELDRLSAKESARGDKLGAKADKLEAKAAVAREKTSRAEAELADHQRAEVDAKAAVERADAAVSKKEDALREAELALEDDDEDAPPIEVRRQSAEDAKRDHVAAKADLKDAEGAATKAERAREKHEALVDRLDTAATAAEEKAAEARADYAAAKTTAELYAEDARLMRGGREKYAAATSKNASEAGAALDRADAAAKAARSERDAANAELDEALRRRYAARDDGRAEAEARYAKASERFDEAQRAAAAADNARELARIKDDYWKDATAAAVDGDGDGIINEGEADERRLSALHGANNVSVARVLRETARAHNDVHPERRRRASTRALHAVWERGAALAAGANSEAWALGRVRAFLHLLANGEPEHPAYTADDDLLPVGHERRRA